MKCLAVLLLVLAPAHALPAQQFAPADTQAGDFSFKMPPGWSESQSGNTFLLNAPSTQPGASTVIALLTYSLNGNLRTTLNTVWTEFQKSYRVLTVGQVVAQPLPAGNRAVSLSAGVADARGVRFAVLWMLARNGDKAEGILFMTNDLAAPAYNAHQAALESFINSLHFQEALPPAGPASPTSTGNPGQAGSRQPGGLDPGGGSSVSNALLPGTLSGIYRLANGSAARGPGDPSPPYLVFFASGRMRRSLPNALLDDYDDAYQMSLDQRSGPNFIYAWGTYRLAGDQGTIVFPSSGERWDISRYPDRLQVHGATYIRLYPGNGVRLDGTYKPVDDPSKSISFKPDGSMIEEGVIANCTSSTSYSYNRGIPTAHTSGTLCFDKPRAGRYRIANYAIEFSFPDTTRPRLSFWLEPGGAGPDAAAVYINQVKFQRAQ